MLSAAPRALLCSLVVRPLISLRGFAPGTASSNVAATGAAAGRRCVWNEAAPRDEELHRDSFYDTVIETWAQKVGGAAGSGAGAAAGGAAVQFLGAGATLQGQALASIHLHL